MVKGFGCRPIVTIAARSEGRGPKASQEGTRGAPCGGVLSMGILPSGGSSRGEAGGRRCRRVEGPGIGIGVAAVVERTSVA